MPLRRLDSGPGQCDFRQRALIGTQIVPDRLEAGRARTMKAGSPRGFNELHGFAALDCASAQQQPRQIVDAIMVMQLVMRPRQQARGMQMSGTGVLQWL